MTYDIKQWKGKRVLVVGDGMLDVYHFGEIERLNPEEPAVPLLQRRYTDYRLGGALNAAHNCRTLEGQVTAVTVTGNDKEGMQMEKLAEELNIGLRRIIDPSRKTTTKSRYMEITRSRIVLREDDESRFPLAEKIQQELLSTLDQEPDPEVVLLSDYAKGVFWQQGGEAMVRKYQERNIPVLVDCKPKNMAGFYGATLLKPNLEEAKAIVRFREMKKTKEGKHAKEDLEELCGAVKHATNISNIVMTCSKEGMVCIDVMDLVCFIQPNGSNEREAVDVTGAGDTVLAALTLYTATHYKKGDFNLGEAAMLAQAAANIKVEKVGTKAVTANELEKRLRLLANTSILKKN